MLLDNAPQIEVTVCIAVGLALWHRLGTCSTDLARVMAWVLLLNQDLGVFHHVAASFIVHVRALAWFGSALSVYFVNS